MFRHRILQKRILPARPATKDLLRQPEDLPRCHITRDDQCRVVRQIILLLNRTHHLRRRPPNRLRRASRILARRILVPEPRIDRIHQIVEWIRTVLRQLIQHHLDLLTELRRLKERVPDRIPHQQHRLACPGLDGCRVVIDNLFPRRRVAEHPQFRNAVLVAVLLRLLVRFEEHMLVEVRQAVVLRRLSIGAIPDGDLDRHQRNRPVFDHDHFKPVRQCPLLPLWLRAADHRQSQHQRQYQPVSPATPVSPDTLHRSPLSAIHHVRTLPAPLAAIN